MTATILRFPSRRDVVGSTLRLLAMPSDETAAGLLSRHAELAGLVEEARGQVESGRMMAVVADMVAACRLGFDAMAHERGVEAAEIEAFNAAREDRAAWVDGRAARRAAAG